METTAQFPLALYGKPTGMTAAGEYAPLLEGLPGDIPSLTAILHGLLIHEHMAHGYGVTLTEAERSSVHIRPVEPLLARLLARDGRPFTIARPPAGRLPVNCRHFTVLMTAMLRAHGTPARARCGFGGYFGDGRFEDHWVCEYWNAAERRWVLVDAQVDDQQRDWFGIDFDVTDVPRDRFLTGGRAWARYRAGAADPALFGLSLINEAGAWWIAANLMRDAAALRNIEVLPWDGWGAMPGPEDPITAELALLFDRLAALTETPDASYAELDRLCQDDERLRVPPTVRSAARGRDEPLYPDRPAPARPLRPLYPDRAPAYMPPTRRPSPHTGPMPTAHQLSQRHWLIRRVIFAAGMVANVYAGQARNARNAPVIMKGPKGIWCFLVVRPEIRSAMP